MFAIIAVISIGYVFKRVKYQRNLYQNAGHASANVMPRAKIFAVTALAVLAIAGAIISAVNSPAIRAFANGNAEGIDFKNQITATVHEDTQTVTFETNYFTNNETGPIHIDHSSLNLSEEAKAVVGEAQFYFEAKYIGQETRVFKGEPDEADDCVPTDQTALTQGQTHNIEYNTNITYDIAKKLCDVEEAFTLELVPSVCYTATFSSQGADSGEPPHCQTVSVAGEGVENVKFTVPGPGTLVKENYTLIK